MVYRNLYLYRIYGEMEFMIVIAYGIKSITSRREFFNILYNYFVENLAEMLTLKKSFKKDNKCKIAAIPFSYSKLTLSRIIVYEKTIRGI
jgi:hypothetical protein